MRVLVLVRCSITAANEMMIQAPQTTREKDATRTHYCRTLDSGNLMYKSSVTNRITANFADQNGDKFHN